MKAGNDVVAAVCAFPAGQASIRDRLKEIDWERNRPMLTVQALKAYIREHPDVIDGWVLFSADKRNSGGFYLLPPEDAESWWGRRSWTVGRLLKPQGHEDWEFADAPSACADYILRELDFWGRVRS